jgi:hypothetical protein
MKSNKSFLGLFLAVLAFLPSCIMRVPSYRRQPLSGMGEDFTYNENKENLNMHVKQLSVADKHYLFDNRSKLVCRDAMQVIYFSFHNLSKSDYIISPDTINLKQVPYSTIDKSMKKTSSVGRFVITGLSGAALATTPFTDVVGLSVCGGPLLFTIGASLAASFGILALIGGVQTIKSFVINGRISKDIKVKTLHEKVIIKSGKQYDGLIFVKLSDYSPQFAVTMYEKDNAKKSVTFDVDLEQHENCA